jgi:hypothetical protein
LEDTSTGLQWASSLRRAAQALTRLGFVLAMPTRSLVAPGTEGVKQGERRGVAPHGCRGQRSVQIGWHGMQLARSRGLALIITRHVSSDGAPEPAMASTRQDQHDGQTRFAFAFQDAA